MGGRSCGRGPCAGAAATADSGGAFTAAAATGGCCGCALCGSCGGASQIAAKYAAGGAFHKAGGGGLPSLPTGGGTLGGGCLTGCRCGTARSKFACQRWISIRRRGRSKPSTRSGGGGLAGFFGWIGCTSVGAVSGGAPKDSSPPVCPSGGSCGGAFLGAAASGGFGGGSFFLPPSAATAISAVPPAAVATSRIRDKCSCRSACPVLSSLLVESLNCGAVAGGRDPCDATDGATDGAAENTLPLPYGFSSCRWL